MAHDESGSPQNQNLTARDVESLSIDEITKELDKRGVDYKAPPRLMASINAFRERESQAFPRELTEDDKKEIARIERTPIEIIRAELDRLGVNHRAGLAVVRRLVRGGVKPSFWGKEPRSLTHLAATIAVLILSSVWFWQISPFCPSDDGDDKGEAHADVMGAHKEKHPHERLASGAPTMGLAAVKTGENVDGATFALPTYEQAGDPLANGCDAMAGVNLSFGLPVTAPPGCAPK
jgi:hypothetical protein